jgi:hypothetical protein
MAKKLSRLKRVHRAFFSRGLMPRQLFRPPRPFAMVRGVRFSKLVQREIARGLTMRLSREIGKNPFKVITRKDLPPRLARISEQDLIGLRARAERASHASQLYQSTGSPGHLSMLGDFLGDDVMFDSSNYIRSQGGRASIGANIMVSNPETGVSKEFYHEFIVPEVSDVDALEILIAELVEQICESPQFEYLCDQSSVLFDYDVTGISLSS